MFVSDERVPVTCDESPGNTIYIRRDLTDGELSHLIGISMGLKNAMEGSDPGPAYEQYKRTLKHTFVVGWDGPAFASRPFTPANLDQLGVRDPLNRRVNAACQEAFQEMASGPKATL